MLTPRYACPLLGLPVVAVGVERRWGLAVVKRLTAAAKERFGEVAKAIRDQANC